MKKISIKDILKGVVAVIAAATLFSCGEKTQSEKVIKDFIETIQYIKIIAISTFLRSTQLSISSKKILQKC